MLTTGRVTGYFRYQLKRGTGGEAFDALPPTKPLFKGACKATSALIHRLEAELVSGLSYLPELGMAMETDKQDYAAQSQKYGKILSYYLGREDYRDPSSFFTKLANTIRHLTDINFGYGAGASLLRLNIFAPALNVADKLDPTIYAYEEKPAERSLTLLEHYGPIQENTIIADISYNIREYVGRVCSNHIGYHGPAPQFLNGPTFTKKPIAGLGRWGHSSIEMRYFLNRAYLDLLNFFNSYLQTLSVTPEMEGKPFRPL